MSSPLHRIAGAGNVAALVILVMALANAPLIFESPTGLTRSELPAAVGQARIAVLVVIDGLRADTAENEKVMPRLCGLAKSGGWGRARVQCLVPSTIAGVTTLATGIVPAPASFLQDFSAKASTDGGIFAALKADGGKSCVAGPALWMERYSQWTADVTDWEDRIDPDAARLAGGLEALRSGEYRLIVFHFGRTDAAEHRFSPESTPYFEAAAWCDDAVGKIIRELPKDACLVVTSDHGAADGGGHGGPENNVLETPVIVLGPGLPTGHFQNVEQRDVPRLLCRAMNLSMSSSAQPQALGRFAITFPFVCMAAALFCGCRLLASLTNNVANQQHFLLNLSLWICLLLTLKSFYLTALVCALAVLMTTAAFTLQGDTSAILAAIAGGAAFGVFRFADAIHAVKVGRTAVLQSAFGSLMIAFPILILCGLLIRRRIVAIGSMRRAWGVPRLCILVATTVGAGLFTCGVGAAIAIGSSTIIAWALASCLKAGSLDQSEAKPKEESFKPQKRIYLIGIMATVLPVVCTRCLGQTVSLSAIDVHKAFDWAWRTGGLEIAIVLVVVTLSLPTVAVWLAMRSSLCGLTAQSIGALAGGVGSALLGQGAVAAIVLCQNHYGMLYPAIALDLLLRVLAEAVVTFIVFSSIYATRSVCNDEARNLRDALGSMKQYIRRRGGGHTLDVKGPVPSHTPPSSVAPSL